MAAFEKDYCTWPHGRWATPKYGHQNSHIFRMPDGLRKPGEVPNWLSCPLEQPHILIYYIIFIDGFMMKIVDNRAVNVYTTPGATAPHVVYTFTPPCD